MKYGREKIGNPDIDWKEVAFGVGKNRRKTVGFGKYDKREKQFEDEFYIRELSIVDGGIGCALWDAAIILSRWIYSCQDASRTHNTIFENKLVLELGAGVGLPGICAARWAKECFLTDYISTVNDNMQYNVDINTSIIGETDQTKIALKNNVRRSSHVIMLNWDHIWDDQLMMKDDPNVQLIPKNGVDIILGSELTYTGNNNTINNLVKVIDTFLKPNGVFVEVLSDDRDGVSQFLEDVKNNGYTYSIIPVEDRYLGNFNTKQRPETYKFYIFVRQGEDVNNGLFTAVCESMLAKGPSLVEASSSASAPKNQQQQKKRKTKVKVEKPVQVQKKKKYDSDTDDEDAGGFSDFFLNENYEIYNFNSNETNLEVYHLNSTSTQVDLTGQVIWPAAHFLARYLTQQKQQLQGATVLELGCGVGLPAFSAALNGCSTVVVTDDPTISVVERLIKQNVDHVRKQLKSETQVSYEPLKWGDDQQLDSILEKHGAFELIIGADITYNSDHIPLLAKSINQLLKPTPSSTCYIAYPDSSDKVCNRLIALLQSDEFNMQVVHIQPDIDQTTVDKIHLMQVNRKI